MRNKFSLAIYKNIKKNNKIFVIAADISPEGEMAKLQKTQKNFINVGVAEQLMAGCAAGLAASGFRPFIYTIATFAFYRPFEMIRDDICYQNLPVTIVSMGAGTVYANLGGTHTAIEDISIARSLPNMNILSPCDPLELEECINYCCNKNNSPMYLRIGKSGEKNLTNSNDAEKWKFGKIRKIKKGKDICIIAHGPIVKIAFDLLEKKNLDFSIYSCHTLKPFDELGLQKIFNKYKKVIVLEDHSLIGGLSEIIRLRVNKFNFKGILKCMNLKDKFIHCFSSQKDLWKKHGISENRLLNLILSKR